MLALRISVVAALLTAVVQAAPPAPAALPVVWEYATPGVFPQAIVRDGTGRDCLYVALKNGGLAILDVSRSDVAPTRLATINTGSLGSLDVMHLTQQGDLLYLALGDFFDPRGSKAGLAVVSVADPRRPRVLSLWTSAETMHGAATVLVRDRYAYLGAMNHGVLIFDVGDPREIRLVAKLVPDIDYPRKNPNKTQRPNARGLALQGQYLYVAFDSGGLRVIDVGDPLQPVEVGRYLNPRMSAKQQAYNNLVIDGNAAYVATDYAGVEVLNIADPRHLRELAWWNPWKGESLQNLWLNSPGHTNQLELDPARRLLYLSGGDSELIVLDVAKPERPRLVAHYGEPKDKLGAWSLTLSPDRVYLAYITARVPDHGTGWGINAHNGYLVLVMGGSVFGKKAAALRARASPKHRTPNTDYPTGATPGSRTRCQEPPAGSAASRGCRHWADRQ